MTKPIQVLLTDEYDNRSNQKRLLTLYFNNGQGSTRKRVLEGLRDGKGRLGHRISVDGRKFRVSSISDGIISKVRPTGDSRYMIRRIGNLSTYDKSKTAAAWAELTEISSLSEWRACRRQPPGNKTSAKKPTAANTVVKPVTAIKLIPA